MTEMLLDREGDALIRHGYLIITTEVAFLESTGNLGTPLHVRGAMLCDWAESFFQARAIPYRYTESPTRELMAICPNISMQQAQSLFEQLANDFAKLPRPLSVPTLLTGIYPNRFWRETPSRQHAAEWLIWLYEHAVAETVLPLVDLICDEWLHQVKVSERKVYEARNSESAVAVLDGWLGLTNEPSAVTFGEFPLPVPNSMKLRARTIWKRRLIETSGRFFTSLAERTLPASLKQLAAEETADFYKVHPEYLNEDSFAALGAYLSVGEQNDLRRWLRPAPPTTMPSSTDQVLNWFQQEYLPFRMWQSQYNVTSVAADIQAAAQQFAQWYLEQYPAALAGSKMRKYLSFVRSAALASSDPTAATLLVVLDGLHVADARHLQLAVQNRSSRLTIVTNELAFAPLPTITQFCKAALLFGVQPDQVEYASPIGQILPERESPVERLKSAKPGTLYVWRVLEPDNTYHKRNSYDTLRRAVEGQLDTIASNIVDIVDKVPDDVRLRIVVTTDHGRLLADSVRTQQAPEGMEVHGRTAWGTCSKNLDKGFGIEGNIAYLHPTSFGLPNVTAVILDESAFTTQDGKGGSELFPHGGLFPEEVIIPWTVYERDIVAPSLEIVVFGRAQATKQGSLEIRVINLGDVPVTLRTLELTTETTKRSVRLDWKVQPTASQMQSYVIDRWPSSSEIKNMKSSAQTEFANGLAFDISAKIELQSDEMYQRDDILEGLDL